MKTTSFLLAEEVKSILCNMAVEDKLPMDMTELDILSVFEQAEKNLKENEMFIKAKMIEALSHMVSDDDVVDTLAKLEAQAEIDGSVMADDVVTMWQPLENRYTVDELLTEALLMS